MPTKSPEQRDNRVAEPGGQAPQEPRNGAAAGGKRPADASSVTALYAIPLRDIVVSPDLVVPIMVGRPVSVRALELALLEDKKVFLVAQRKFDQEDPEPEALYQIGCISRILQTVRMADGSAKVLVEGLSRAKAVSFKKTNQAWLVAVEPLEYAPLPEGVDVEALTRVARALFEEYAQKNPKLPEEIGHAIAGIEDSIKLLNLITGHLTVKTEEKIALISQTDLEAGYHEVCRVLSREIELLDIEHRIYGEVRKQIDDQQRSYFLHEQIKAIERELGKKDYDEVREYKNKIAKAHMPPAAEKTATTELEKLERMPPFSPEGSVIRNYLDWLLAVPWRTETKDNLDLHHARRVLDETHYGLKEPKERVLEFLAVRRLRAEHTTQGGTKEPLREEVSTVLCLVGPPGVGKTSLARAVADALGRKFVRISLGGVRDEAEIRGHRRTYIGALPGRIVQGLKKAGTRNPVMLLDEVDKIFSDFRGDPSAALLEVLDPEQNRTFNDHYLEVDIDLSDVIFVCTANVQDAIHPTLRDRMEKIELSSYTEQEKVAIALKFLVDRQRSLSGIPCEVQIDAATLAAVIRDHTHEAGVRQLDRSIAKIMRKLALEMVTAKGKRRSRLVVGTPQLRALLGTPKHRRDMELPEAKPGVAVGLAWTDAGGEILKVEVTVLEGKGELILTGQLGEVMQESARAAVTYMRKRRVELGLATGYFAKHDLHIHVPEGAIPKDGPSAGITLATALYSALSGKRVKPKLAMTGEITLGGTVLGVGGLKEKLLAAHRAGVTEVIVPARSEAELDEVPPEVLKILKVRQVRIMDEVIACAFEARSSPRSRR